MVITKDLSRLGRDYIKTGYYLENYFPEKVVRYVSINDGIDTFIDSTSNDITPFKAIMNDMYAKDISKKIRSVIREKQKNGDYRCTFAPYGYKKDTEKKNHLIVDEKVRSVVEEIFELYATGKGTKYIAHFLSEKGIPSPISYLRKLKEPKKWNDATILNMLKNEVYIGNTIANKKTKLSYKSNKRIIMPKEQYIITEDTHEAIIDKKLYEKVKVYLDNKDRSKDTKYDFLFRGLLTCKTCHSNLCIGGKKTVKDTVIEKPIAYISCNQSQKGKCNPQSMNYQKFESQMLAYIQDFFRKYANREALKDIYNDHKNNAISVEAKYKKEMCIIESKVASFSEQIDSIYFDKINKVISEEDYFRYSNSIFAERKKLEERKKEIESFIDKIKRDMNEQDSKVEIENVIEEFLNMKEVTRAMLYRLIDRIEIDEKKRVYIFFTFSNFITRKQAESSIYEKPKSLVFDLNYILPTILKALEKEQIQPILL